MPSQSEISTRLSADNSEYRSVMNQTIDVTDKGAKAILKKLDLRAGVGAIAAAIGFNLQSIAEGIGRLVTGVSKEEEEALRQLATLSDQVASRSIAASRAKLSAEQQYQLALQDQARLQASIDGNRGRTAEQQVQLAKDKLALLDAEASANSLLLKIEQERTTLAAQRTREDQLIRDATLKANREIAEEKLKFERDIAEATKHGLEKSVALDEQLWRQRIDRLPTEEKINALERERRELLEVQKTTVKGSNDFKELQLKLGSLDNEIARERLDLAERTASAEKQVTEEKRNQVEIGNIGRGDTRLSDRELERKIQQLQSDVGARSSAVFQGGLGKAGAGANYDPLLGVQQSYLQQAIGEADLRAKVRRDVSTFGESRAFAMNSGLTETRFKEIVSGLSDGEKTVRALDDLRIKQEKGLQAIAAQLAALNQAA